MKNEKSRPSPLVNSKHQLKTKPARFLLSGLAVIIVQRLRTPVDSS